MAGPRGYEAARPPLIWLGADEVDKLAELSQPTADSPPESLTEGLFEAAFRHSPDVVLLLDARSGSILDVSLAVRRYLGYEPEDLVGSSLDILWPEAPMTPDAALVDTVSLHGGGFGECEIRRIDGSSCCMLMRASLGRLGHRQAIILTLHDITARKRTELALSEAEGLYRGIFENAIEGMFQTTPEGRYLSANRALARICGYTTPEALSSALTDIAGQLYVDPNRRAEFQRALQECDEVHGFESEVNRHDGSRVWISENARAVRDSTGRLRYYEGTVVDVSERRRAQEEQERAIRSFEHSTRLRSEFVGTMSHELRTPLNIILGYTELLVDGAFGDLSTDQLDVVDRVQKTGRELLELINAALDLNRLDAGAAPLDPQTVDVVPLLAEVQSETRELQNKPGVSFSWCPAPTLPPLDTDPRKLKVVLKNLVANAAKFTESGSVRVSAEARDGALVFEIRDSGIGIPDEAHELIFEPFRQLDGSEARRYGGVGLGLHIVKRVLAVLGGAIEVESQLGVGSTFRVTLPIERQAL